MSERKMTAEAEERYRSVLLDEELMALRSEVSRTVTAQLASVASWLGVDAFLGGGDVAAFGEARSDATADRDRYAAFRGVSAVVEMAAELGTGAVLMLDTEHRYAAAALVRQLIEGEYLLRAFVDDIARAAEWYRSTPGEIRKAFMPKSMRPLGGFSDHEYWTHSDQGGHPSPHGRHLLRFGVHSSMGQDAYITASMWGDLAQHLRRVWAAVHDLLAGHHARFTIVRASELSTVNEVLSRWIDTDPLAEPVNLNLLNELAGEAGPANGSDQ